MLIFLVNCLDQLQPPMTAFPLVQLLAHLSNSVSLDAITIKKQSDKDTVLSRLWRYILSGWPAKKDEEAIYMPDYL